MKYFDVPSEEQDIITDEERKALNDLPKTIHEVMKDVVIYVDVRSETDNRSDGIKKVISQLGATVNDNFLRYNYFILKLRKLINLPYHCRNTTHVIFKDGLLSTYQKSKRLNIPIVSILWIEACRSQIRLCNTDKYPISNKELYEHPELYPKFKVKIVLTSVFFFTFE